MEWQTYKFLTIQLGAHTVCAIENKTGTLLGCFSYPAAMQPTALCLEQRREKACLALKEEEKGAVYILNLQQMQGYRLPIEIPAPLQFTITPDFKDAYFVTADATLHHLDIAALQCHAFARPEQASCVGLAVRDGQVYSAWEAEGGGSLAIFAPDGTLRHEQTLCAVPTNLCLRGEEILIPFTESRAYGEGLAILTENTAPRYLTIQGLATAYTPHIYPCSVTLDEKEGVAYLVHEDGGSISIIHTDTYTVHKTFSIGRSISNLYLLPDSRFALATSNMFADLTLLDLVNQRLLSVSESSQEFSNLLAILA